MVHFNSTVTRGGVAEILQPLIPITKGSRIAIGQVMINTPPQAFQATKEIHNLLQGAEGNSPAEVQICSESIKNMVEAMRREQLAAYVWFPHRPQLLPLAHLLHRRQKDTQLWICHPGLTTPNSSVLETLMPLPQYYDTLVFLWENTCPMDYLVPPVYVAPPAVDPLAVKKISFDLNRALKPVATVDIDPERPWYHRCPDLIVERALGDH